jgi:hypothetical protein
MNQLKRLCSLQRKRFGYDRATVAPGVWDSNSRPPDSMDRKMAVFQSLTTPGGIRLPSCQDNTKFVRTSSFICSRKLKIYDKVDGVMSKNACRVSRQVVEQSEAAADFPALKLESIFPTCARISRPSHELIQTLHVPWPTQKTLGRLSSSQGNTPFPLPQQKQAHFSQYHLHICSQSYVQQAGVHNSSTFPPIFVDGLRR